MNKQKYDNYVKILEGELVSAMGCTEPIAIALAAATARQLLGVMPDRMVARCSGNVIKNVKGVSVPNADGQKGVEVAAILGAVAGDPALGLEVIRNVPASAAEEVRRLRAQGLCTVQLEQGTENLFIRIEAYTSKDTVAVEMKNRHNRVSKMEKNGIVLQESDFSVSALGDRSLLNLRDIIEFANTVQLSDVEKIITRQIEYNSAISQEGLRHSWGAAVGQTILSISDADDLRAKAAARAASGSDARMGGCAMPVVINSGSGNQGITCTMPVVTYAEAMHVDQSKLIRALVLTNLIACHQKRFIGNLSAYCGAVSAGTAAACGVAYLHNADYDMIGRVIINSLATNGGIICDGAKCSCASKIASAVSIGLLGYEMAKRGHVFHYGEGLVEQDYERTIQNFGRLGKSGMKGTDLEILNIMIGAS